MKKAASILLVEDSPGDIWLTKHLLSEGPLPKEISVVTDGEQAIDFLEQRGHFQNVTRPNLVLLDLNLPRRSGLDVLRHIKRSPMLRNIAVVMLTTSEAPSDITAAYDLNANCYIVKPLDIDRFAKAVRAIEDFFLSLVVLAPNSPPGSLEEEKDKKKEERSGANGPAGALKRRSRPVSRSRSPLSARTRIGYGPSNH